MAENEQAHIDIFKELFRKKAQELGKEVTSFSLGGQDRDVGADYLFTRDTQFAVIEFKASHAGVRKEAFKPRRLKLCSLLEETADMAELHDRCHFIVWGPRFECNIYRLEACNRDVFGDGSGLVDESASAGTRVLPDNFFEEFFTIDGTRSLCLDDFERYLAWLMHDASGSEKSTVELLAWDHDRATSITFASVRAASSWLNAQSLKPAPHRPRQ